MARARGKLRGKKPKLSARQARELRRMYDTGDYSVSDLADVFSVSRPTVYRPFSGNQPPRSDQRISDGTHIRRRPLAAPASPARRGRLRRPGQPGSFHRRVHDGLDLEAAGFERVRPKETGRPGYDPPDRSAFRQVSRDFVRLCRELDLDERELVAVDGSRIKAVNNRHRNFVKSKLESDIERADAQLERYLKQMDDADSSDSAPTTTSVAQLREKIASLEKRRETLKAHRETLERSGDRERRPREPRGGPDRGRRRRRVLQGGGHPGVRGGGHHALRSEAETEPCGEPRPVRQGGLPVRRRNRLVSLPERPTSEAHVHHQGPWRDAGDHLRQSAGLPRLVRSARDARPRRTGASCATGTRRSWSG